MQLVSRLEISVQGVRTSTPGQPDQLSPPDGGDRSCDQVGICLKVTGRYNREIVYKEFSEGKDIK